MNRENGIINRRILIIDDSADIQADFKKILSAPLEEADVENLLADGEALLFGDAKKTSVRPTYEIDQALQGQAGLVLVEESVKRGQRYAMAFVDMRMPPGWDGLETIENLWKVDPDLQVVICSAHSDHNWADISTRLGHTDKLLIMKKPFEQIEALQCASALTRKWQNEQAMREHVKSLESAVAARLVDLEAANGQLRHLATHDALTGLPNRLLLDDRLSQAIASAERRRSTFAVMVLDLDRFKVINDSLGHRAGDTLLCEVASRLSTAVRGIDTVARIGGDEFVLVLGPLDTPHEAQEIATRILDALAVPMTLDGVEVRVTPSIGVAFYPQDATHAEALIGRADAAMYCAKERGRNTFVCFAEGMDEKTREQVQLESALHEALKLGQLELHYQPKADISTGEIHSAEALIRWRHPTLGLVPPNDFIPLAEQNGLIIQIGEWVIREACRQSRRWQDAGLPMVRIAVNVAASQFRHGNLLAVVRSALNDSKILPQHLELELTESAVMTNPEESTIILEQLRAMGVLVSVDDFGTGYSSMGYLRQFPIDKLKIDRSFIRDLMSQDKDASIVRGIISLAHDLKLKVIAEGVESSEQLHYLKTLGCDQYQGYHLSKALPAAEFSTLLKAWFTTSQLAIAALRRA